jgi:exodeoxyribonuclease VII small subunit
MADDDSLPNAEHGTDELGYGAAMAELDRILAELDADDVDIDVVTARVTRAAALVRHCRDRVTSARLEIETVVAQLGESDTPVEEPAGRSPDADEAEPPDHPPASG